RAPTCSATTVCGVSRSITATSRSWWPTGAKTQKRRPRPPRARTPHPPARVHPRRNIVTRALGIEPDVRVDWWTLPLIRGDRFVLCSDGLVDEVADTDITTILLDTPDPQEAAEALVDAANAAGGRDNITVIVVDVLEGDDPPDPTLEIDVVPVWADAATRPTPAGPFALDPDAPADATGPLERTAIDGDEAPSKRSGLGKFAIAFAAAAA